jgi:regulator of sirC expression with transglutaminase-like and TPR domain
MLWSSNMEMKSQIPFLLNLADDEDHEVRQAVYKELSSYEENLEDEIMKYPELLNEAKLEILKPLLEEARRDKLKKTWRSWFAIKDDAVKLETAMDMIAAFQLGADHSARLPELLDSIADEFAIKYPDGNEIDLAAFLFKEKGIDGEKKDYYNPLNSNLVYVIENKRGLPISLAIIYILTGYRLGLNIEGCNFPGHFLAKTYIEDEVALIDGFNGGRVIYERDIQVLVDDSQGVIMNIIKTKTSADLIIKRTLNNLIYAYQTKNDKVNSDFFAFLHNQIL